MGKLLIITLLLSLSLPLFSQSPDYKEEELHHNHRVLTDGILDSLYNTPATEVEKWIELIGVKEQGLIGFPDVLNSNIDFSVLLGELFQDNWVGMNYAFLVELYIYLQFYSQSSEYGTKKPSVLSVDKNGNTMWKSDWDAYRLFKYWIIVKKNKDGEALLEKMSYRDMKRIQRQYRRFWNKYRHLSREEMQRAYERERGILREPYCWI